MTGIAYLDASALVKLIVPEPESAALAEAIGSRWPHGIANEILTVEVHRAALRAGGDAPAIAARRLRAVALLPLTAAVREQAERIGPSGLRALDAIHLAAALAQRTRIDALVTYDGRLASAARNQGLVVETPGSA